MLYKILLDVRARFASHLETRDIRIMLNSQLERTDKTLEAMKKYQNFLSNPKSPGAQGLYTRLSKESRVRDRDLYSKLYSGLETTSKRLSSLIDLYENNNHRVLISSSMTTINLNALHLASICDFYEKSLRALVLSLSELESLHLRGDGMPKELRHYMERNFTSAKISSLGSIVNYNEQNKREDVVKVIREMDDIEVTEETLAAAEAMGGKKRIDAAGFNYLNIVNPSFWAYIGFKSYSELRLLYLDMEKDELEMLEIRHQELAQLKANGESDLATDKLINTLKDRIDIKRYDIKELEESMG